MEDVQKLNNFSRNLFNIAKKGAYYTPTAICKRIALLFRFPDEEFNAFDPTCGDGEALLAVVGNTRAHTLGVELDSQVAKATDEKFRKRGSGFVVEADFFVGFKSSYNVFDFCFSNPPYMKDVEGRRHETRAVEKIYGMLRKGAYLAVVIPYYLLTDEKRNTFVKPYIERYEPVATYRFDDKDYEQFQQVVLIGKKRNNLLSNPFITADDSVTLDGEAEKYYASVNELEKLPYLPNSEEEVAESFVIKPSAFSDIRYFTSTVFDSDRARRVLREEAPMDAKLGDTLSYKEYGVMSVGNPPVPLRKDHMYLAAVSGAGQGLCGREEDGTLHLQRGITQQAEQQEVQDNKLVVQSYIKTGMVVVQNDGTITRLN